MPLRARRLRRGFRRDRQGATAVEFAILAPVFIVLLLNMFDFGYMMIVQSDLDSATAAAARQIRTGQTTFSSSNSFRDAVCGQMKFATNCSATLLVSSQALANWSTAGAALPADYWKTPPWSTGSPGQVMLVRTKYAYRMMMLNIVNPGLSSASLFQREPGA